MTLRTAATDEGDGPDGCVPAHLEVLACRIAIAGTAEGLDQEGELDPSTPVIQRALAATAEFGVQGELARSSTDSNVPIALGIPAVTIGRGGQGANGHAPDEFWINVDAYLAVQRALVLVLAEAGFAGPIS